MPPLREVRVLEEEESGLPMPAMARKCAFALVAPQDMLPVDRGSPQFLGWHPVCVGLRSSSAQRRKGLWLHREDWLWFVATDEDVKAARTEMARNAATGQLPALVQLSAPVQVVPGTAGQVVALGPSEHPVFRQLQWRLLWSDLPARPVLESSLEYILVKRFARRSLRRRAGDEPWDQWVL